MRVCRFDTPSSQSSLRRSQPINKNVFLFREVRKPPPWEGVGGGLICYLITFLPFTM